MMVMGRTMGRSFAASMRRRRRAFAYGRSTHEEEEEEGEEAAADAEKGSKWGSQRAHLEGGMNAYQVLGVSPSCSPECIREAFTKLAKLTHPDLQPGNRTSTQFILVVSAYQILSSPASRAQYHAYIKRCLNPKGKGGNLRVKRDVVSSQDMEVAEWLRWYRKMTMAIVHQHEIETGRGSYDEFRANLHEAMKRAYFGPHIDDDDGAVPHCFEAEERAEPTDPEVLHLVSGHKLIGAVLQVDPIELLEDGVSKFGFLGHSNRSQISSSSCRKDVRSLCFDELQESRKETDPHGRSKENLDQSAFMDLELYLYGNLVARATRAVNGHVSRDNSMDEITVYLCYDRSSRNQSGRVQEDVSLGTIVGLNTTESGGKGRVYSTSGEETHIIWQFRTPWVKHLHWFKLDGKRMLCECRSTRAHLPSSKYWLFEPRCGKHDIGGWYIETLWRKGSSEPGTPFNWAGKHLGLLHPAMYILCTAYKTLDSETTKRRKKSFWSAMWDQPTLFAAAAALKALQWCKVRLLALKH